MRGGGEKGSRRREPTKLCWRSLNPCIDSVYQSPCSKLLLSVSNCLHPRRRPSFLTRILPYLSGLCFPLHSKHHPLATERLLDHYVYLSSSLSAASRRLSFGFSPSCRTTVCIFTPQVYSNSRFAVQFVCFPIWTTGWSGWTDIHSLMTGDVIN